MIGAPNDAPTPTIPRHFCALLVVSIYPTPLLLLPLSREEAFLRVFSEWPLRARLLVVAFQQQGFEHVRLYGFAKVVCACALTLQPPLSLLFSMKVFLHVLLSSCLRVLVSFVSSWSLCPPQVLPYETVLRLPDPRAQSLNLLHVYRGWLWFGIILLQMIYHEHRSTVLLPSCSHLWV